MNQCKNCKASLPDIAKFCNKCGTPVESMPQPEPEQPQQTQQPQPQPPKPKPVNTGALIESAYYIREGENVEKNVELAITMYKKVLAAEPYNSRALYGLVWCYYDEEAPEKNKDVWFPLAEKAAGLGNSNCQKFLGDYFADSVNDYEKALEWYEAAAQQDNISAMYCISYLIFFDSKSGINDRERGLKWAHRAYDLNDPEAAANLGNIYYELGNKGDEPCYTQALKYYMEAALKGEGYAAYWIGQSYLQGKGVGKDIAQAVAWLKYGDELGCDDALFSLAVIFALPEKEGLVDLDPQMVLQVLEKASDKHPSFCVSLMKIHLLGTYGTIDQDKADFYCNKFSKVLAESKAEMAPDLAVKTMTGIKSLANISYSEAFAKWVLTPDTDIKGKLDVMALFQENIDKNSDLKSLKTLAGIYGGLGNIPRYKSPVINGDTGEEEEHIIEGVTDNHINSVKNDEIINYKKAFELLEKGIAWGDEECKTVLNRLCSIISHECQ